MNGHPSDMPSSRLQKLDDAKKLPLPPSDVGKRIAEPTTTTLFKWWGVDFTTTMEEYQKIDKERLAQMGIHMGIVTDDEHTVIASQFTQRGQKKKQAHEVRNELFLSPPTCGTIETAVVLTRYDLLVSLKPGTNVVKLAGIWDTVDKIVRNNVMHSTRSFGDAKTVTRPHVFVHFPPVLSLSNVNKFMHHWAVQDIQLEKHGTVVATYVYIESAYVAVGVSAPFGQYGMITITVWSQKKAIMRPGDAYDECHVGLLPNPEPGPKCISQSFGHNKCLFIRTDSSAHACDGKEGGARGVVEHDL